MINLDQRYESYLHTEKRLNIDGEGEKLMGYGFTCDGVQIDGYYILTKNYKLYYNLQEQFKHKERWQSGLLR